MDTMSPTIAELAAALAQAQAELNPAQKNASNPMLRNKYADLSACIAATREVLPKHGLAVSQVVNSTDGSTVSVTTILLHKSGEWLSSTCTLPSIGNKGVNPAQAAGSAITYARRYGLSAIIGLATDDDDDGCGGKQHVQAQKQAQQQHRQEAKANNPQPPTDALTKRMWATLGEICGRDEESMRDFMAHAVGHPFQSSKELTADEIKMVINAAEDVKNSNPFEEA